MYSKEALQREKHIDLFSLKLLASRVSDFVACEQQGADQPLHQHSLIIAFGTRFMDCKITPLAQ